MTNGEVIRNLYQAFADRDYEAFRALCHPDVEWIQNVGFPVGGHHRGPQAIIDNVFRRFDDAWESFGFRIDDSIDAGDTVLILGQYEGRHRATGKAFTAAAAHLYELSAGRLVRYRQFADTRTIWDAMS